MHLIHPALVHLSVSFLVVGGTCELAGLLGGREGWRRFGQLLVVAGAVSLVFTIASGYLAANSVPLPPAAAETLAQHERNGLLLAAVAAGCVLLKARGRGAVPAGQRWLHVLAIGLLVALATYSAWLGGGLVYHHGVGVAPSLLVSPAGTAP